MRGTLLLACLLSLLGLVASAGAGCGSESSRCGTSDDCVTGQVCEEGVCQNPSTACADEFDCAPGEQCLAGQCARPTPDAEDVGVAPTDTDDLSNPNNPTPDEPDASTPDVDYDNVSPRLLSVTPPDGTADVAVDGSFTLTFDEPLEPTSVNFQSIQILDPSNALIAATPTYTAGETTVVLTPNAPLLPATGYRIRVTSSVRDPSYNPAVEAESRFYTGYEEPADLAELAATYAPTIYQSLGATSGPRVNIDIPTRVDFDGNAKARDNEANALRATWRSPASVYYSVIESQSHYFLTYVLYYPIRHDETPLSGDGMYEHDFTGLTIVVDRATGEVLMAEGVKTQDTTDTALGYHPASSPVGGTGAERYFAAFPDEGLEGGTHFPLFIPAGVHEACNWYIDGPTFPAVCRHGAEEFSDGPTAGVILRPGAAQTYDQAVDEVVDAASGRTIKAMEYELVPLAEMYARRVDVGQNLLWERDFTYSPIGGRLSVANESPIKLPGNLMSDDAESLGKPPFAWLSLPGEGNPGQWLLDPAFILSTRYDFSDDYTMAYCYNLFLGIDLRDAAGTPACATMAAP